MEKSVLIIGGGVAGLCTGIYAAANGYKPLIVEMNSVPGGLCSAWPKGDYTIDMCLHWLTGAIPDQNGLGKAWQFLGVLDTLHYIFPSEFMRVVGTDGKEIVFSTNLDELEANLLACAPEDHDEIMRLMDAIRAFARTNFGMSHPETWGDRIKFAWQLLSIFPYLRRYGNITLGQLGAQFKNPLLAGAMGSSWDARISALILPLMLAWASNGTCGYPIGGSKAFIDALVKRYLELGGVIRYNTKVAKIIVDNKTAIGAEIEGGEQLLADWVISAADGFETIFQLLEGRFVSPDLMNIYRTQPVFGPLLFFAFGVNRSFEEHVQQLSCSIYQIPRTKIADREHEWLQIKIHNQDPTLAPTGKTVISVLVESDFEYWEELVKDRTAYDAEKAAVTKQVIALLDGLFPGFAAQVEMEETVTPHTIHHLTGNWKGSYEGWLPTPQIVSARMDKTLPGLNNFFMVGHWVQPGGGLPSGAITAKEVVNMLCKQDNKPFVCS